MTLGSCSPIKLIGHTSVSQFLETTFGSNYSSSSDPQLCFRGFTVDAKIAGGMLERGIFNSHKYNGRDGNPGKGEKGNWESICHPLGVRGRSTQRRCIGVCIYIYIISYIWWSLDKKTSGKVLEEWNKEPVSLCVCVCVRR